MINITNIQAKRLYVAEFERNMNVLENTFIREIRPLLGRQFFNAASLVAVGELNAVDHAVNLGRRRLINILQKHYRRTATVFSRKAYKIFEKSQKSIEASEIKTPKDEFWLSMNKWSRRQGAQKIRGIQTTTKKTIAKIIRRGQSDGESHREIAKRIRKTSAAINPHRSRTIALTETHTAAVKSVDAAVASTRIEMEREWVSAKDDRTRTRDRNNIFEHFRSFPAGADGEKVTQDGLFKGTGQALRFPGDSRGSAGNVIRCRCVIIYHTVKRTQELKPHEPEALPVSETQGGRLFKNEADAIAYNNHFERFSKEKLTRRRMAGIIEKETPKMHKAFARWKSDTNGIEQSSVKFLTEKIEKREGLKAFVRKKFKEGAIEKRHTDAFKDQYLKLRALQQAKFQQEGRKTLKLYRGTDGNKTGPAMRQNVIDLKNKTTKAGQDWKLLDVNYKENSLSGYSKSKRLADSFGKNSFGVTVGRTIDIEDILIDWDEIFNVAKFAREKEVIILGGKKQIKLGIFDWKK